MRREKLPLHHLLNLVGDIDLFPAGAPSCNENLKAIAAPEGRGSCSGVPPLDMSAESVSFSQWCCCAPQRCEIAAPAASVVRRSSMTSWPGPRRTRRARLADACARQPACKRAGAPARALPTAGHHRRDPSGAQNLNCCPLVVVIDLTHHTKVGVLVCT